MAQVEVVAVAVAFVEAAARGLVVEPLDRFWRQQPLSFHRELLIGEREERHPLL